MALARSRKLHMMQQSPEPLPPIPRPSREDFEKDRLKQRREGFRRYGSEIDKPFDPSPNTALFQPPPVRYHTDVAGEEQSRRMDVQQRQNLAIHQRRQAHYEREDARWSHMRELDEKERDRQVALQQSGKARKNMNSMPINPITGTYGEDTAGVRLLHTDQIVQWRAAMRSQRMEEKTNGPFNPITGEERRHRPMPVRPASPSLD